MYCKHCGAELGSACKFCPECGAPQTLSPRPTPYVVPPTGLYAKSSVDYLLEGITAVLFGLSLIGGGCYALLKLTEYTGWAIPGGLSTILAGVACAAKGGSQLCRRMKKRGGNSHE